MSQLGASPAARLQQLFAGGPLLTLERSSANADAGLWATGAFGAGVYPDLPIATTWPTLLKKFAPWWGGESAHLAVCRQADITVVKVVWCLQEQQKTFTARAAWRR